MKVFNNIVKGFGKALNFILIGMVKFYRIFLSPLKGTALLQIYTYMFTICVGSFTEIWALKRFLSCNKKDFKV